MKRILLLFSFLTFGLFSSAQNIDSVVTTAPVLCNGGLGDITVYTDATGNVLYDLLYLNTSGNWQTMIGPTLSFTPDFTLSALPGLMYRVRTLNLSSNLPIDTYDHMLVNPPSLFLNPSNGISSTSVSCFNGNDGTATINMLGGTSPYSYLWSDGQTTQTANGLAAGTYTCIVTDTNGCSYSGNPISVTVNEPLQVDPTLFTSISNVACYGDSTGYIGLNTSGGTPPYTYLWSTGETTSSLSDIAAGVYSVVVTDANGCTQGTFTSLPDSNIFTITQPQSPLSVSVNQTNVSCHGESTGNVTLFPSGGTSGYSFIWSNGQTNSTLNNLSSGVYDYIVTDQNNCTLQDSIIITQPDSALSSNTNSTSVSCNGYSDGSFSVNVLGGTTPYSYLWSNGSITSTSNLVSANTYSVIITDSLGCLHYDTVTVSEPNQITAVFTLDSISCPSGNDGILYAQASGGTPSYNYSWSTNSPNGFNVLNDSTIEQISEGTYTVIVDDANLCSETFSYIVLDPEPLTIGGQVVDVLCHGENSGSISTNILGGTPPYSYVWLPDSQTTSYISSLSAGTYTVNVNDANDCYSTFGSASASFLVNEPSFPLQVTIDTMHVICFGQANGSAMAQPTGGVAPYTYLWSTNETTQSINNLTAGSYSVVVEDANLCQHTVFFNITEPDEIVLSSSIVNPTCYGFSNGSALITPSGGNGNYSYLWTNGHTGQSITGLSAGSYGVTVTDGTNLCSESATIQVSQPSPIDAAITTVDNLCFGGSSGSANTQITDPFPPFDYIWSTGDTTPNIANLSAGTYTFQVRNSNGCIQSEFYVNGNSNLSTTFEIFDPIPISITSVVSNISVNGANDGSISVVANGGYAPYSYLWSGPNGFSSTSSSISNLSSGFYTVLVTDLYGCTYDEQFTINEPNCNVIIDTTYYPPLCFNDNAQELTWLNSGGIPPYTSELTDDDGNNWYGPNSGLNPISLINTLPPGLYTLNVSDANGCLATLNIPIISPDSLEVSFVATDVQCFGENNGSLSAIASGGTPANGNSYTYVWSPNNQTTFNISNLIAGTYSVIVTDANNCQILSSHTINEPANLEVDSVESNLISCNPGSDGSATVFFSGGTQPYNYFWNMPNSGIPQTTQSATQLSVSGNYTIDLTDANGCTLSETVFVDNAPTLIVTDSVIQPLCYNDTNGIIYANITGGSGPYNYSWSQNGVSGLYSSSSFIANLSAGTYSVIVEDSYGCVDQFSTQVINPNLISVSLSTVNVSLNGANDGSISSLVSGGIGSYSYSWYGPSGFTSTLPNISSLSAGTYTLIVIDDNGCSATYVEVINEPACNVNFDTNLTYVSQPLCFGQTGQINWMASGGGQVLNPTTITDNINGTTLYSQSTVPNQVYTQILAEGNYSLYVEDEFGCSDVLNFSVASPNLLSANTFADSVSCFGGNDGSISLQGIGGTPPYIINYGTDPITGAPLNENQLQAGTYTTSITDANGCLSNPSSFNIIVYEPNELIVNYTTSGVTCFGSSDGEINLTVSGGTFPYSYAWQGSLFGVSTPIISNLTSNLYFVEVTDFNGCQTNPQITSISVPGPNTNLNVSINTIDASCFGFSDGQAQAFGNGGTPPYSYAWSNGQTSQTAIGLSSGTYTCVVTDANGCVNFAVAQVGEPDQIVTNLSTTDVSCFGLNNGFAQVNPNGGSGTGFGVLWTIIDPLTGLLNTNLNVSGISPGAYNVTVSDFSLPGCDVVESFIISQPDILQITTNVEQIVTCDQGSDGELSVFAFGGVPGYNYNWSSSSNNSISILSNPNNLSSQMYYVDVTDTNGCVVSDSIYLGSNDPILANLTFDNISCFGGDDGIAYANPTGGTAPYTYFWSVTGSTSSSSTGLNANTTYSVQITDANNCPTLNTIFTLSQPDSISMYVSVDSVSCYLGTDGSIVIDSVTGAIAPYTYLWSNGQTGTTINNLIAGTYNCIVTDAIGCVDSSNSIIVYQPDELLVNISITSNYNGSSLNCYGDSTAELTAISSGGTPSYSYLWSNGESDSQIDSLSAGTYSVNVYDINGCQADALITVNNPDSIDFNYSLSNYNGSNVSCFGYNDGTVDVHINGAVPINYSSIIWTDSIGNLIPSFNILNDTILNNLTAGVYNLSVLDINGCYAESSIELFQPDLLFNSYSTDSVTCFGGNDGSAYANPLGGTAPYQISWSTGSTNDTITGLNAYTTYYVQISDTNNCPMVLDTVNISQPDSIQVTSITTTPTCYGINDGQIIISSITGATGPYTYLWNDSSLSTGTILANINSGEYICTITDALGCVEDLLFLVDTVFAIEVNANIISDYNGLPLRCYGDTNAILLASTNGGTPPYSYSWSNGYSSDTIFNVGAGLYTVFAQDANGCDDFVSITVNNPDSLSVSFTTSSFNGYEISCDGYSDGFINTIITGGNGINYNTLLWNTGDTSTVLNNLITGTYSLNVEDFNGCGTNASISLHSPGPIVLDLISDSLICFGDSNATANVNILTNAITPINYLWSDGQTNPIAINLVSGIYSLTITDANNCMASSNTNVYQPDSLVSNLVVTSSYNGSNISCYGYNDAFVSVSSSGGVSPYLYSLDSIYYSSVSTFNNLGAGLFNVLTRDNNGCENSVTIDIIQPDNILANLQIISNPSCNGVYNGEITSLTSGGTGLYSYIWSSSSNITNVLDSITEGIHAVQITDANGCIVFDTISVDAIYSLTSSTSSSQVSCVGYSDGSASVVITNGVTPYSFVWNNGMTTANISNLTTGIYTVSVVDSNGCQISDSVFVSESDSVLAFTSNVIYPLCNSDSTGSISVIVTGGLGNYSFNWSTGDTTSFISNLPANTYVLDVYDSVGCIVSDTFNITEPLALTYNLISNDITCYGLNNAEASVSVNGGTTPYTFSWIGPSSYISNNPSIDSLLEGVYYLEVIDSNGCSFSDSIVFNEPDSLTSSLVYNDPLCYNSNDGFIAINVSGGTSPYSSSYGSFNPSSILGDSIVYTNLPPNSDILYVLDANGCENYFEVTLIEPTALSVYNLITTDPTCYDYSNGYASMNAIGGTPPYTYELQDINSNVLSTLSSNSNLSYGLFLYVVTDDNGCFDDVSFELLNPAEITISTRNIKDVDCFGDNTGLLSVDVNNFTGSYEIVWMPSEYNTSSDSIFNLPAGQYDAVVIDELGCTKLDSFNIEQNDKITSELIITNSSCKSINDGEIEVIITGGVEPFNIYLDNDLVSSNVFGNATINNLLSASYSIRLSDVYECSLDSSFEIGFNGGYNCINEPIIITPNSDNYNDEWIPILDLDVDIEVNILNRWGQKEFVYNGNSLSFSWNGIANWGGTRNLVSSDYYYIIKFNNDQYPDRTGVITLIR